VVQRRLGRTGLRVGVIGFGAFKIGRNRNVKYGTAYDLPDEATAARLLNDVLDAGINLIDTAPAYGLSEARIGRALMTRRSELVLCTKAGERFDGDRSTYDFSSASIRRSLRESLERLQTDVVDVLLIHSDGNDEAILERTDAVATLHELRDAGLVRAIGFSGKTVDGALTALGWADVLMVEYHPEDESHAGVLDAAAEADVGVLVKKPLASGRLSPEQTLPFILANDAVSSVVIGGLDIAHVRDNIAIADACAGPATTGR